MHVAARGWSLLTCLVLLACPPPPRPETDAGTAAAADAGAARDAGGALDAAWADAGTPDAAAGEDAGGGDAGVGETRLTVVLGGVTRPLTQAHLGLDHADGGVQSLYVEVSEGGDPGCPETSSPTPLRTLILSGVPAGPVGATFTAADGVHVTLLDFQGDLLPDPRPARAVSAEVVVQELVLEPAGAVRAAGTLRAAFDAGSVTGTWNAGHCASMDD